MQPARAHGGTFPGDVYNYRQADLAAPLVAHGHGHGHGHDYGRGYAPGAVAGHGHSHAQGGFGASSHDHGGGYAQAAVPGHGHGHGHSHGSAAVAPATAFAGAIVHGQDPKSHGSTGNAHAVDEQRKLRMAVYFALFFMLVEIVGGVLANSLAIITDAAHMLSDVGGFMVSLVGLQFAARGSNREYTYGYQQAEVLGALLSICIVWALTAILLWEAIPRFVHPEPVDGPVMLIISVIGFVVNLALMKVLGHGHAHGDGGDHGHAHGDGEGGSVAMQAALAHVVGDIVQSLGVCVAAALIWQGPRFLDVGVTVDGISRWNYADPCCTVLFSLLVMYTTKSTFMSTLDSLMVKAPARVNQDVLIEDLSRIAYVDTIHDLHIWSLGSKEILCTAHLLVRLPERQDSCSKSKGWFGAKKNDEAISCPCSDVLRIATEVARRHGIGHSTFQIELMGYFDVNWESVHGFQRRTYAYDWDSRAHAGITAEPYGHGHTSDHGHSHAGPSAGGGMYGVGGAGHGHGH